MDPHEPSRASADWPGALRLVERVLDRFFTFPRDALGRLISGAWLVGLLLFGLYQWGIFFSWGNLSMDFLDWAEVTGPRYALLQDALRKGELPLHAANMTALRGVTDRYFSIADTPFTPQLILLRLLEIGQYLFVDVVIFYLLGFAGLVLLARKYYLSPLAFLLLFLLFNFNGHITGHFGVGHSIWTGYFLLPFYVYLVLDLLERGQAGWKWVTGMAILMLVILLQGFFHLYLWCLMFLGVLGLFNLRLIKPVLLGGLFSVLVALPRLLPPALALSGITQRYLGGFATLTELFQGLLVLRDPDRATQLPSNIFPLKWWELDYFIGLLGFAILVIFGILLPLWQNRSRRAVQVQVLFACLVFTAFSLGQVFGTIVRVINVPPLTGERVTSRMFVLPLVFLIVLAVIHLQRALERRRFESWVKLVFLGLAALLYHDLSQHFQAWRIRYLDGLVYLFPKVPFNAAQHTIANHSDPVYFNLMIAGFVVAVPALLFLLVMSLRKTDRRQGA